MSTKNLIIASDHGGFRLKEALKKFLLRKGYTVKDIGAFCEERCDYPVYAYALAKEVSRGRFKKGILICKSGIGNSIVANRVPGVRAALCYNAKAAELSREHNDSNVLVLGALFVRQQEAKKIVSLWIKTKFAGGRHLKRLNEIRALEKKIRGER
jgi:RpiB/LacA/LacB family sugar-phosphate isomerase